MASFKPSMPFNVPTKILKAESRKVNGIQTKRFTESEEIIWVSAKSFGGTERVINDTVVVEDTVNIETWYRPDITAKDRIKLLDDGSVWEIINEPENIERKNQFLKFKCRRMKGGA